MLKYITVIVGISLFSLTSIAQTHKKFEENCNCTISPPNEIKSEIPQKTYEQSIHAFNWDNFRLNDKKRIIKFDNGYEVVLKAKNELENPTINAPIETNLENIKNAHYKATFDKSGNVMMLIPNGYFKEEKK